MQNKIRTTPRNFVLRVQYGFEASCDFDIDVEIEHIAHQSVSKSALHPRILSSRIIFHCYLCIETSAVIRQTHNHWVRQHLRAQMFKIRDESLYFFRTRIFSENSRMMSLYDSLNYLVYNFLQCNHLAFYVKYTTINNKQECSQ